MKQFCVLSISLAILITTAALARADDTASGDVPVNDEPALSDAIVTGNSNADRSPAGWYSDPDDSATQDESVAGL